MSKSTKSILTEINDNFLTENKLVFKKYKPIKEIGKGSFGKIYSTIRLEDKSVFAMKTEKRSTYGSNLETEAYYLLTLKGKGIPELISYGQNAKYNILIETLLDKSLFDLFLKTRKLCNITDLCLIALQLIERLEFIHSKDLIYRDVKPENFMIGMDDPNVIYITDYGLCKKYRSSKTGKHIQPKYIKKFIGTLKYASSNVLKGKESSRRDDLISLGFVLIHLHRRNLTWNSLFKDLDRTDYLNIIHSKETFDDGKLFRLLPEEMVDFLKYINNLGFEQDPNYSFMKGCFKKILMRLNFNKSNINFTWIKSKDIKLLPNINLNKEENSRNRRNLKKNKSKKSTIDTDNSNNENDNINKKREIRDFTANTFDGNKINISEEEENNVLKRHTKKNNEQIIDISNRTTYLQKINNININNYQNQIKPQITQGTSANINDNNNNIFLDNENLDHEMNVNMNVDIIYKGTFALENIIENKKSKTNYRFSCKDNSNNNYSLYVNQNVIFVNNDNFIHNRNNEINIVNISD